MFWNTLLTKGLLSHLLWIEDDRLYSEEVLSVALSKPSLVSLISKDANLVFYVSVNKLFTLQSSYYDVIITFCVDSTSTS